jgi:hypothetical protein
VIALGLQGNRVASALTVANLEQDKIASHPRDAAAA